MIKINNFNANRKILKYSDKLNLFFNRHKTLVSIELDLTNKCNNECPGCTGIRDNPVTLDYSQVICLVDQLKDDFDLKSIIISGGGEPLLHKKFVDILYYIKSKGISVGLNSNGVAITKQKAKAILECCDYFRISLDADSPEMYKKIHGDTEKVYNKVLDNIAEVSKIKKQLNSKTSFGVGFLTGSETKKGIVNFVRICKERGADFAQIRPFTGDFTDVQEEYELASNKYSDNNFNVISSNHKFARFNDSDKRPYEKCYGMFFNTVITADYRVFACLHHRQNDKYLIGDLSKNTLKELWSSSRIIDVYNTINFSECPLFCRNDDVNRGLQEFNNEITHAEFL